MMLEESSTTMASVEASGLTEDLRKTVMPVTIFFGFEILVGLVGNSLTIYVFLFRYKACNFRYFVVSLAVTDLIACLTTIPAEIVSQLFWYTYPVPPVCKIKAYFNQWTVVCEAAFLTMIALDRYRKICRPFKWQINRKRAIYACYSIFAGASLLMIQTPIFWGVRTDQETTGGQNVSVTVCEKDEKFANTSWPMNNVLFVGVLDLLAVLSMFIMYIMVAKEILLRKQQLRKQEGYLNTGCTGSIREDVSVTSMAATSDLARNTNVDDRSDKGGICSSGASNDQSREVGTGVRGNRLGSERRNKLILRARRKSMMGFILTAIFVVTTVLYWPLIILVSRGILSELEGATKVFFFFFLRLYFINHIINPVLYGLMDPLFRQEMHRLRSKVAC